MTGQQDDQLTLASSISLGAGLAIATAWLAGAAVTITILLIEFVWATPRNETVHLDFLQAVFFVLIIAAPMIAAYKITKIILGRDD